LSRHFYISYAWSDLSDPDREKKVDEFCDEAKRRRISVQRDKTALRPGDLISEFMQKMGESDRVYIFLSDKYLKSAFCMFELFEVFRNSKQQKEKFLQKMNIFSIDGVGIYSPQDRLSYSEY